MTLTVLLAMAICTTGCSDTPEVKAKQTGKEIWFEEDLHDYGEIEQDSDGTWAFVFKNLGKEAIIINRVRATCGCTVVDWPKEPFEPGSTGEITVKYNTATTGTFFKSIIVYSSAANSPVKLQVRGRVFAAAKNKN